MKVLIIEDEQPAARRLQKLVNEIMPHAEILRQIDSVEESVEFFQSGEIVDLIFMDIQLADGISFDIFTKTQVNAPVIFTTAFDHYAVKAFKVNSVDYLLKPIEKEDLRNAIAKFELIHSRPTASLTDYSELIKEIREQKSAFKKRFLVKTAGRLTFVNVEDVAFFFSDDGNSFLVTQQNDRFLLETILEDIESQLDPSVFFRINRKMMLSLSSIKKIEPHFNNRFIIQLQPAFEEEVIVSRQRSADFRKWLDA